jgi:hypothetical protein
MRIVDFISTLHNRVSSGIFPEAELDFDGNNLSIYYKHSDSSGDFMHIVADLACMGEDGSGAVAVHARPEHIFMRCNLLLNLNYLCPLTSGIAGIVSLEKMEVSSWWSMGSSRFATVTGSMPASSTTAMEISRGCLTFPVMWAASQIW